MNRFVVCGLLLAVACGGDDDGMVDAGDRDAFVGGDAGARDAGGRDSGGPRDSGVDAAPADPCDEPGASEQVSCGRCGQQIRFCTVDEVWEYGPCGEESGTCTPGDTDTMSCGNCGAQTVRCNTECEWETAGACGDEGECAPGERQRTSDGCEEGETRELLCAESCVFEESMECINDECPAPGTLETVSCGRCGTQERFCTTDRVWEYSACTDEGVCDPGTSEMVACGNCGMQVSRCNTECEWAPAGACMDEGECRPGRSRTTTTSCDPGEERRETCNDACTYEAGACMPVLDTCGDLDILFVIDDSGSMGEEITNLVAHADDFVEALDSFSVAGGGTLDWRIGVTTTGRDFTINIELLPGFPLMTLMETGPDGALLMPDDCGLRRRWIQRSDGTRESDFACLADVGTTGSGYEMPILAIDHAITDRVADGSNAGFLRSDAMLGVIVITDEDDCSLDGDEFTDTGSTICTSTSLVDVADTISALDAVKGRDRWATFSIAGPGPGVCTSSFGDAQDAIRIKDFNALARSNTDLESICVGDLRASLIEAIGHFYDVCQAGL
ncbi:MAG: hypothetical protein AAGE52_18585 [Myxococcota bacterium]